MKKKVKDPATAKDIHLLCIEGNIDKILDRSGTKGNKRSVMKRALDILIGLSLKGYEGKPVGAIYLIGDIEGIRRNSTQMIINPFKGWRDVNVKYPDQLATIEAFTQLDGALVIDVRGMIHYAGRMINVREVDCYDGSRDFSSRKGKGSGTRWRAARFITSRTRTIALTLSSNGNITVFMNGIEIGGMKRRLISMDSEMISAHLIKDDSTDHN